jgi:hypothetical protein
MNYQRIYDQIIDRAKQRKLQGYIERHHIVPKCLGGSDDTNNLVELTAREHFLCHHLLTKIHPGNNKIFFAFWAMCTLKTEKQERYVPSSKLYEETRKTRSVIHSANLKRFYKTPEGIRIKKEAVAKVDQVAKIKKTVANTDYVKRTANTDWKARTVKMDWKAKVINTDYKSIADKNKKPILQFDKSGTFIKEWASIKEAGKSLNIYSSNITNCAKGRERSAGGFIWKYKDQK